MQAITICQPSSTSNNQTLICLPFSCFALLVPHCCSSAFWIAVARFALCILHQPTLEYVAAVPLQGRHWPWYTTGPRQRSVADHDRIFASYHLIPRRSTVSLPHWLGHINALLEQRLVACPSEGRTATMSLAYKVEELLALRDSVSESAVSLDRFADEDVIKGQ